MFTFFQKRMKLIFIVLLFLIAPGFLLFGIVNLVIGRAEKKVVGTVFGKEISGSEFVENLKAVHMVLFLRYPQQYESIIKFYNTEQLVWNRILMAHTAAKYRIRASKKDVQDYIQTFPLFKNARGDFDVYRYGDIVNNRLGLALHQFEKVMQQSYINEKLLNSIQESVIVFDSDIRQFFQENNEEVKIEYLPFSYADYTDEVTVSDEALAEYFQEHKENFKLPEQIKVKYIICSYEDMEKQITLTEEEMKIYYESHKDSYKADIEKKGKNTEAEPESVEAEQTQYQPYEDVVGDVREKMLKEKSKALASAKCRQLFYDLEDRSLADLAGQEKLTVRETKFFSRDEVLPEIGVSPDFQMTKDFYNEIFQIKTGETTSPIKTTKGVILAEKMMVREAHIPDKIDEVSGQVAQQYIREKSSQMAVAKAGKVLAELKEEEDDLVIQTSLKQLQMEFQTTDYFRKIDSYVKGIGVSREFMSQAFTQKTGDFSQVIRIPGRAIFFRVIDKKEADFSKLEEQRPELKEKLQRLKSQRVVQDWMAHIQKISGFEQYPVSPEEQNG